MIKKRIIIFFSIFTLCLPLTPVSAAVKAGATCKTAGSTSVTAGKTYTCIKSGKKLIWNKGLATKIGTPIITAKPTPSETLWAIPTSFEDLYENRKGVSLGAWQKSGAIIRANTPK